MRNDGIGLIQFLNIQSTGKGKNGIFEPHH